MRAAARPLGSACRHTTCRAESLLDRRPGRGHRCAQEPAQPSRRQVPRPPRLRRAWRVGAAEHERAVLRSKTETVAEYRLDFSAARAVRNEIQIALRIL